jgi:hypothetical protein
VVQIPVSNLQLRWTNIRPSMRRVPRRPGKATGALNVHLKIIAFRLCLQQYCAGQSHCSLLVCVCNNIKTFGSDIYFHSLYKQKTLMCIPLLGHQKEIRHFSQGYNINKAWGSCKKRRFRGTYRLHHHVDKNRRARKNVISNQHRRTLRRNNIAVLLTLFLVRRFLLSWWWKRYVPPKRRF